MSNLETYFAQFRENIVGIDAEFESPYGKQPLIYADWIASGRLYAPIEDRIKNVFGPLVGNTHSETSETGTIMTNAYHLAHHIIKEHVNADENDILLTTGTGMTGAVNKLQRILGLKVPERAKAYCKTPEDVFSYCKNLPEKERPVVFVTHMEHHSNHTSWLETIADVVVLEPDKHMRVDVSSLEREIKKYEDRELKIGAFSGCSNVTGLMPPYYQLAEIMHEHRGYCFVDFAASAPYVKIDMHPENKKQQLDAIFFSPHKFLGGPGSCGILVFSHELYQNETPDHSGGGTVSWTDRWGRRRYVDDVEAREDGGTPGFLQAFRAAMSINLKQKMKCENIRQREDELIPVIFESLRKIPKIHILADEVEDRLGVFSFYVEGIHHNLLVRLLNDRYGIQVRGGCSCAGTYGHFLLHVDILQSKRITERIDSGDLSLKPGWVRMSIHPTMTNDEIAYILNAINEVTKHAAEWEKDYFYQSSTNEFFHRHFHKKEQEDFRNWFAL